MKQGWDLKKIGEIGTVFNGNSINAKVKKEKYMNLEEGLPYIATKDISYESVIDYGNGIKIPDEDKSLFKIASKNTIFICAEGGSAGRKIAFTDQEVCFGNKLFALSTTDKVNSRFVYYYYFSPQFQEDFASQLTGIIGGVSMAKFKKLKVPLPSLTEQQRIVEILDKAFVAIDKAKQNVEQNLRNAKEVFEGYLNGVFENKGDDWEARKLDDVCKITSKLIDPKEPQYHDLIHIGAGNIISGKGTLLDLKTAKEEELISGKFLFDSSMVLYSKIRPYLMKIIKCNFQGLCSADIYPLKPVKNKIIQEFLYYLLLSKNFTEYAVIGSQRAGMPKVNRKHLFEYFFHCPSIQEQIQISQDLDMLSDKIKKLETIYEHKLKNLTELKKSTLQKAFEGNL
ncbi:MAG: restriction endonuclease subunit S [Gammaproteobacteria bacterium]|nr:MAG: restriction endonuclease subunit S [Gammaproteobacteria bacterium]